MRKMFLAAAVMVTALIMASAASAQTTGYLEICKHADATAPVSGNFHYTVDGTISVTVPTGGCSPATVVPSGNATVVEDAHPYYAETAASTIPQGALVSSNLVTQTQVVTVPASADVASAVTLNVTNKEVTGTLEVCKNAATGSGLTGSFSFRVTGPFGFSRDVSVPVGACSQSLTVPAGVVEVNEIGANNTDLVSETTVPANDLVTDNLAAGTSQVRVAAGGVASETIVTFTNSTSRLKVCKIAGTAALNGTVYTFTATVGSVKQTVTAVAGPAPGNCVLVATPFPGGTKVDVQEGIVPGTAVTGIAVSDNRQVPGSINLASRDVLVTLGSGETIVTFTNDQAAPGLLKVCKNAGPGVTVGAIFHFTIGTQTLDVPAGYCAVAGSFPFNSTQTITEAATPGLAVIGEAADPAAELVSENLSLRQLQVQIGAGVTEATFTNATAGTATLPDNSGSGTGNGTGATNNAPTTVPVSTNSPVPSTPVVEKPVPTARCIVVARLVEVRVGGVLTPELLLSVRGNAAVCNVLLREFNGRGIVIAHTTRHLRRGHTVLLVLSHRVARVRAVVVK